MDHLSSDHDDTSHLRALYDELLCNEEGYSAALREGALQSLENLPLGITLKEQLSNGDIRDFDLKLPKYGITALCALTGGGKTATMTNWSVRLALQGYTGFYVTLEEPHFKINARMMACHSVMKNPNYSSKWLWRSDALKMIGSEETTDIYKDYIREVRRNVRVLDANMYVDQTKIESPTLLYYPQQITNLILYRNKMADKPIDFVFIDFGQLMEANEHTNGSHERIKSVMQALKNMCGSLGIAVIVGAQVKRECRGLSVWKWAPEYIRDGSDFEQAASLIVYVANDNDQPDPEWKTVMKFGKNRDGTSNVAGVFKYDLGRCVIPDVAREPVIDAY